MILLKVVVWQAQNAYCCIEKMFITCFITLILHLFYDVDKFMSRDIKTFT